MSTNQTTSRFNVAVVATMSSGKSTILNAMLGAPLLPSRNEACTAKVFRISDVDGLENCRACGISEEGKQSDWFPVDLEVLDEWNTGSYREIHIEGDFPHIANHRSELSISFYDTPGPNNSRNASHAEITNTILSSSQYGFLVCVLNATQFGVNDESDLLSSILEKLKRLNRKTKIVFAVNKIDCLDVERDEEPLKLIRNVKRYLRELGYFQPVVIPTISSLSLTLRQILTSVHEGTELAMSSRMQRKALRDIHTVREFAPLYSKAILHTPRYKRYWQEAVAQERSYSEADDIQFAGQTLSVKDLVGLDILTGIPILEEYMESELRKFAKNVTKR